MIELTPTAQPYAAAILAVEHQPGRVLTDEEIQIFKGLSIERIAHPHVAFASYIRRLAEGEPPETLDAYLEPARSAGELNAAWQAVAWLNAAGEVHRALSAAAQQSGGPHDA